MLSWKIWQKLFSEPIDRKTESITETGWKTESSCLWQIIIIKAYKNKYMTDRIEPEYNLWQKQKMVPYRIDINVNKIIYSKTYKDKN